MSEARTRNFVNIDDTRHMTYGIHVEFHAESESAIRFGLSPQVTKIYRVIGTVVVKPQ